MEVNFEFLNPAFLQLLTGPPLPITGKRTAVKIGDRKEKWITILVTKKENGGQYW